MSKKQSKAWQGAAGRGLARHGEERRGGALRGMARQGNLTEQSRKGRQMSIISNIKRKIFNRGPYDPLVMGRAILNGLTPERTGCQSIGDIGRPRGLGASKIWQDARQHELDSFLPKYWMRMKVMKCNAWDCK